MNLYIAWSVTKLVLTLTLGVIALYFVLKELVKNKVLENKHKKICIAGFILLTLFSAINVGERQSELGRSSFNSSTPKVLDKVELDTLTSDKVKENFKSTLEGK